jgi:hypothetical protein
MALENHIGQMCLVHMHASPRGCHLARSVAKRQQKVGCAMGSSVA